MSNIYYLLVFKYYEERVMFLTDGFLWFEHLLFMVHCFISMRYTHCVEDISTLLLSLLDILCYLCASTVARKYYHVLCNSMQVLDGICDVTISIVKSEIVI